MSELTPAELDEIEARADAATPGPWFVRLLDDTDGMSLVAVSTQPDTGRGERWPDFDHATIVAATLVQQPRYASIDGRTMGRQRCLHRTRTSRHPSARHRDPTTTRSPGRRRRQGLNEIGRRAQSTTLDNSSLA